MTESAICHFTITITLPADLDEDQVSRFADSIEDPVSVSAIRTEHPFLGPWQILWLVEDEPNPDDIATPLSVLAKEYNIPCPDPVISLLPDINWLEHSYRQFPPFSVGPFFIHGNHCSNQTPPGQIDLEIEAATAFGSGEHGTTSGCMLLMDELKQAGVMPLNILDMGCGSGILAIAACKLWEGSKALAIDIDPESVHVTEAHRIANHIGEQLQTEAGDGFSSPSVAANAPYDLIIANILPGPLKMMAGDLMQTLKSGGYTILSGLLQHQADAVIDVYRAFSATEITRLNRGEWTALLLKKS